MNGEMNIILPKNFQNISSPNVIINQFIYELRDDLVNDVTSFVVQSLSRMKNDVFWDVAPCGSCKNGRFAGT
jgi:hypothetical protein